MIRTIVTPTNTNINFTIPKEYIGKPIEITYIAFDELEQKSISQNTMADFWGILSDETAEDLHKQLKHSRNEWEERINKQI